MSTPRQNKSGSKSNPRKDRKKKGGKRPHPDLAKLNAGAPTAEQIARGEGTAGILGGASPTRREPGGAGLLVRGGTGNRVINGTFDRARVEGGTGLRIIGGAIGGLDVRHAGRVALESDVIVRGRVATDVGSAIEAKAAFLGDRFVDDMEIATRDTGGVVAAQIASKHRVVVSALGGAPDRDANHARVGRAVATALGSRHAVIPEVPGEAGARLRDGTTDVQVDVFLCSQNDEPADDVRLQVVILPAAAQQLGQHGAAIEYVLDASAIRDAIAFKGDFGGKGAIDLVVSCPFEVPSPFRRALEAAGPRSFDTLGYSRVWIVDAADWPLVIGVLTAPAGGS